MLDISSQFEEKIDQHFASMRMLWDSSLQQHEARMLEAIQALLAKSTLRSHEQPSNVVSLDMETVATVAETEDLAIIKTAFLGHGQETNKLVALAEHEAQHPIDRSQKEANSGVTNKCSTAPVESTKDFHKYHGSNSSLWSHRSAWSAADFRCSETKRRDKLTHKDAQRRRELKVHATNLSLSSSSSTSGIVGDEVTSKRPFAWVDGIIFSRVTSLVIVLNAGVIALDVDYRGRYHGPMTWYNAASWCFAVLFSIELSLRILCHGRSYFVPDKLADFGWHVFDVVLVVSHIASLVLDEIFTSTSADSHRHLKVVSAMRIIRLARILRVLRVIRLFGVFPELRILMIAVGEAVKRSVWMFILLFIVIFVFAVLLVSLVADTINDLRESADVLDNSDQERNDSALISANGLWRDFGTLPRAMATLFQSITGGTAWGDHAAQIQVGKAGNLALITLYLYITSVIIVLLNVMTGLFCECAVSAALTDQGAVVEEKNKQKHQVVESLRQMFQKLDEFSDDTPPGMVSLSELEEFMKAPEFRDLFVALDIESDGLDAWALFKLLDTQELGYIGVEDFLGGCLKCRGHAKAIDTHLLRYEVNWLMSNIASLSKHIARIEVAIKNLRGASRTSKMCVL